MNTYAIRKYHDQRDEPHEVRLTVTADGEDLNTGSEAIRTPDDLRAFVRELHRQGFYDVATMLRLLEDV